MQKFVSSPVGLRARLAAAALAAAFGVGVANASVIANWTFEASLPVAAGPHLAEVGAGSALGVHASGSTAYSNPVGNGSNESFSSNFWAVGDYYQFQVSTSGLQNITVGWDQARSSTGPSVFDLEFSIDGVNFTTALNDYAVLQSGGTGAPGTWSSTTYLPAYTFAPVSLAASANNQASLWVRMTAVTIGSSTNGTNRIDNVIISGDVIPEPSTLALLLIGGVLSCIRRR